MFHLPPSDSKQWRLILLRHWCTSTFHSPPLGPPVLEPRLDLSVRHLEALRHGRPLGGGEVLLLVEALLQLADLDPAEGRPRLLPLGRRPVLVGVPDPPRRHPGGGRDTCRWGNIIMFANPHSKLKVSVIIDLPCCDSEFYTWTYRFTFTPICCKNTKAKSE